MSFYHLQRKIEKLSVEYDWLASNRLSVCTIVKLNYTKVQLPFKKFNNSILLISCLVLQTFLFMHTVITVTVTVRSNRVSLLKYLHSKLEGATQGSFVCKEVSIRGLPIK